MCPPPSGAPTPSPPEPDDLERRIERLFAQAGHVPMPDPRAPSDPVLTEMVRLSGLPLSERRERLEPYLARWISARAERLVTARYLAAAGLSRSEADALEQLVQRRVFGRLRRQAHARIGGGLLLAAAGVGVGVARILPFWALVAVGLAALGLAALGAGFRLLRRIEPPPQEDLDNP